MTIITACGLPSALAHVFYACQQALHIAFWFTSYLYPALNTLQVPGCIRQVPARSDPLVRNWPTDFYAGQQ